MALTDFNSRQFKACIENGRSRLFLLISWRFSVLLANRCLKTGTIVLITVIFTNLLFPFFIFSKFAATYAFHLCAQCDETKRIIFNKVWFDIYIYDRYYARIHEHVFLFLVWKKRAFQISRVWPCGGTPYESIFHTTIEIYLKKGYELLCRFVEDMS